MKTKILIFFLAVFCLGCSKKRGEVLDCPAQPCIMMFASINVQFKDKAGSVLTVKNYSVVNQRTKQSLESANQKGINEAGYYTIVDDGLRSKLSKQGDDVVVTATHPTTGQTIATTYKISGGCNCHVSRISGPEMVTFD